MTSTALRGQIWFRDGLAVEAARVNGHTATFRLRSDAAETLPMVIAVGEDAEGNGIAAATLTDLTIPIHGARLVTMALTLAPSVVPGGPPPRASEDRVLVWRKLMPVSSCVVVEHWDGGSPTRSFVVPEDDPDCDDVAAECNPAAWHGVASAGAAAHPDCLTKTNGVCLLGSHACADGNFPGGGECAPQRSGAVCLPDQLCSQCTDITTGCLANAVRTGFMTMPHIECSFPAEGGLSLCKDKESATIQLDHFPAGQACEQPLITSFAAGDFATSSAFGGATMELTGAQPPCSFVIRWKGGNRTNPLDMFDFGAIEVPAASGAVLLPLVLRFNPIQVSTCGAVPASSCQFKDMPLDPMWACTH
ncbi:MAG: hypothetical protein E6J90_02975 [Deltaproteobacteria bacterium]|nr:MAG: hypothetical protein E6J90_02975 [Deltaproteobacteria bacterium]